MNATSYARTYIQLPPQRDLDIEMGVVADEGHKIHIPDGSVLENSAYLYKFASGIFQKLIVLTINLIGLVSGNLALIEL